MKSFDVKVVNEVGSVVYGEYIEASDENAAIIKLLTSERVNIQSGDIITISNIL